MYSVLSSTHLPSTLGAGYINTSICNTFKGNPQPFQYSKQQHTEKCKQIKYDPWRGLCKSQQSKQAKVQVFYQAERPTIPTPLVPSLFYLCHLITLIHSLLATDHSHTSHTDPHCPPPLMHRNSENHLWLIQTEAQWKPYVYHFSSTFSCISEHSSFCLKRKII